MKLIRINIFFFIGMISCISAVAQPTGTANNVKTKYDADACVYGATSAGIAATIALAREGFSVILIEPLHEIGGLMGAGFRMSQDVPYPDHLGGLTKEFYDRDINFTKLRHSQGAYKQNIQALKDMMAPYNDLITLISDHRLASVDVEDLRIKEAIFEFAPPDEFGVPIPTRISNNLKSVSAKIFIDASYEGDLMAYSGVSYRVGKESKEKYGESLAGVYISKKFPGVDPYKVKGDPKSGLLECIHPEPIGEEGDSSRFFMAYNFKMAWEREPTKEYPGIALGSPKIENKDIDTLLKRYTEAGYRTKWPEENFQRTELMTGGIPGLQADYPDGDWATRSAIWQGFMDHVRRLNDFSDEKVRLLTDKEDTNGWPSCLYVREGRRMIGEYVTTQHDLQLQTKVPTPVGMGYYKVDIYPNRMGVTEDGTLVTEGNVWERVSPGPYQISYGSIIPKKGDIENILVPICLSASHIACSSIRMESTYMLLGESAGVAAALSLKSKKSVQDIDRKVLTKKLVEYNQLLEWNGKGYRGWRHNERGRVIEDTPWWEKHPEEYKKYPVNKLWK